MNSLLEFVGWNTLAAAVLALAVLLLGRFWKRPELLHVLWLVVLVKLVTPGMVRWNALPAPIDHAAPTNASIVQADPALLSATTAAIPSAAFVPVEPWWTHAPLALWIGGSAAFLLLAAVRLRRFFVALRRSAPPQRSLRERIVSLAHRVDVAVPRTLVVDAAVPPMVWRGPAGALLVLPAALIETLDPEETDAILVHELAHLKRGDPWVRWVELAVTTVLWWNPLVWWVRRNLRRAEEQACDHRVLEVLPESRRVYADSIVKTVEYLAGHGRTPVLGTGATGTRHIEERLIMILNPSRTRRLRRPLIPAMLVALLALPILPGFADRKETSREQREAQERLIELEREALELKHRLHGIERRRVEVEQEMDRTRAERDSVEMERQVQELRRQGMREEAGKLEDKIERMHRRQAEERARQHEMIDREREMRDAELDFREALIALKRARNEDDTEAVEDYELALEMYQRALDETSEQVEAHRAYEKAEKMHHRQAVAEMLKAEMERRALVEQGRDDEAELLMEELIRMKKEAAARHKVDAYRSAEERDDARMDRARAAQAEIILHLSKIELALAEAEDVGTRDELEVKREMLMLKLEKIESELEYGYRGVR